MPKQTINPPELFNSRQFGFSQIVTSRGGTTVYLSGQVAWNDRQEIIGGDDLGEQMRQALRNVETAVRVAGGRLNDVVSLRIYFLAEKHQEVSGIREALLDFFPEDPPATTWIGVPILADPVFLVEVEAVAVIESDAKSG
ncbi:RidA family protein [Chloroflexi bacterium TSY]|nr:RidA family protein [Chloroflexi bacterium TSY]